MAKLPAEGTAAHEADPRDSAEDSADALYNVNNTSSYRGDAGSRPTRISDWVRGRKPINK